MIAFLKGDFVFKSPALVQVDVGGVGYELQISLHTYSQIEPLARGKLFTHLHIREDAHILYGFFDLPEKDLFIQLIGVNGIGAATARIMLSSMKPEEISRAIVDGNVKLLESIKGIGRKTAERIVLELREKFIKNPLQGTNISPLVNNTLEADALNALLALGIGRQAAEQAVKKVAAIAPAANLETIIKQALKIL